MNRICQREQERLGREEGFVIFGKYSSGSKIKLLKLLLLTGPKYPQILIFDKIQLWEVVMYRFIRYKSKEMREPKRI